MKSYFFLLTFSVLIFNNAFSQSQHDAYFKTYEHIDSILMKHNPISFKKVVFEIENAYNEIKIDKTELNQEIKSLLNLIILVSKVDSLNYNEFDKNIIALNSAIFKVLTDTIPILIDSTHILIHKPYTYDFDDMWGEKDWTKMFVSKLLVTGKGNCHSMPYLYKILADELGIPAYLAFAPNHIYIKTYSQKMGWYNTELTSGTFPIDAWIMASGYVTVEAIQNG